MNNYLKIVFSCVTHKYFQFKGRASRKEFCLLIVCYKLLNFIAAGSFYILKENAYLSIIINIYGFLLLFLIIPLIAVFVRRSHDLNFSGWWYLFFTTLISLGFSTVGKNVDKLFYVSIAFLIIFIFLIFLKGTPGPNKYGEPPVE